MTDHLQTNLSPHPALQQALDVLNSVKIKGTSWPPLSLDARLPIKELMKMYHAFINSLFTYVILIYRKCNETTFERLHRLQKRILKIILNTSSDDVVRAMTESKILTLNNAYNFRLLKVCHKMIYNKVNIPYFLQNI